MKAFHHGLGRIGGEFDLNGPPFPSPVEQEIALDAVRCAEIIGLGLQIEETERGEDLLDHETFPTVTDPRLAIEVLHVLHIQKGVQ